MTDFRPRSPATSAHGGVSTFSVATFNIRTSAAFSDGRNAWWLRRRAAVETIRDLRAEIVGLQEVRPVQLRYLARHLPQYDFYGRGRDADSGGEHCPVLVDRNRFEVKSWQVQWLSPAPDEPGSRYPGSPLPRVVTSVVLVDRDDGQELVAVNVHLDHVSDRVRALAVQQLALMIDELDQPVLLFGDFNCNIDDPLLQPLFDRRFRDALDGVPPRGQRAATHHSFSGAIDGDRIDHVFVAPQWQVETAHIDFERPRGRLSSDHWPVVVTLATSS
jgi:endonuclease/exonuclease/phosphatase family metal-dependent hydrolase